MNFSCMEAIADAVLFEGYILYPYRPSSIKNRQRWNFGTLFPRRFAEAQSPQERWQFCTEVLVEGGDATRLFAMARFLQFGTRGDAAPGSWAEGFASTCDLGCVSFAQLRGGVDRWLDLSRLSLEENRSTLPLLSEKPRLAHLRAYAEPLRDGLFRLHMSCANETLILDETLPLREMVQDVSFISAHAMLGIEDGAFVSLLEPPEHLCPEVSACAQDGVFPVLAGEMGDRTRMLCSPIILYDYPQVALESAGNFFDSTEMDEMLSLRVLTLTEEEKAEVRSSDSHARAILERTEILPDEQLARVHGAVRGLRRITEDTPDEPVPQEIDLIPMQPFDPFADRPPVESVQVFGIQLRTGDRVRLWPQKKADILDLAMEGKLATIEAIEQDLEDNVQFAVVLDDDPGRDMGLLRQAGHRFFFTPEEVEPLGLETA